MKYVTHEPIEPTVDNGWASWRCTDCKQDCASDNPCDCCADASTDD